MNEKELSWRKRWQRRFVRAAIAPLVPATIALDAGGLRRAALLSREGYGLLLLMNHFSLRDGLQVLNLVFAGAEWARRPALAPAATHHLSGSPLPAIARALGVSLLPVTTPEALERRGPATPAGINPLLYAQKAITMLQAGGIVLLAPQAGRRPTLGEPSMHAVSLLLAQARRKRVRNVAILFVGLAIPGASDYCLEKVGGLNFGRRYALRIGHTFTLAEALERAGSLRALDDWAYAELRRYVPAPYAGPVAVPGESLEVQPPACR